MLGRALLVLALLLAFVSACGGAEKPAVEPEGETAIELEITSPAFVKGDTIPTQHTCDGADLSPPLMWSAPPAQAKSLALICDDPDAPAGTWVHWVLYDLPPNVTTLSADIPPNDQLAAGGKQGINSWGKIGYGGPCPPKGPAHRYFFKLYALDSELGLSPGVPKKDLLKALEGHVLAEGQLMGRYQRR